MSAIKKDTMTVANKLVGYFNLKVIGSALLLPAGLNRDLINDIDVATSEADLEILNVRRFLQDEGFKETKHPRKEKGYAFSQGSLVFESAEYDLPLHVSIGIGSVFSVPTLIAEKFKRGSRTDIIQLKDIINKR